MSATHSEDECCADGGFGGRLKGELASEKFVKGVSLLVRNPWPDESR